MRVPSRVHLSLSVQYIHQWKGPEVYSTHRHMYSCYSICYDFFPLSQRSAIFSLEQFHCSSAITVIKAQRCAQPVAATISCPIYEYLLMLVHWRCSKLQIYPAFLSISLRFILQSCQAWRVNISVYNSDISQYDQKRQRPKRAVGIHLPAQNVTWLDLALVPV